MSRLGRAGAVVPLLHEFLVNTDPDDASPFPSGTAVAGQADGSYLISWVGLLDGSNQDVDSNGSDILARLFPGGSQNGVDFRVNGEIRDGQYSPAVASNGQAYVVAYSSGEENSLPGTYAASQVLSSSGAPIGPESFGSYSYYNNNPDVVFLDSDTYVVVSSQESDYEARVRTVSGNEVADFRFGYEGSYPYFSSTVAQSGTGFDLIWTGYADSASAEEQTGPAGIYVQSASAAGTVGTPVALLTSGFDDTVYRNVDGAALTNGNIVVAYDHEGRVEALVFDASSYEQVSLAVVSQDGSAQAAPAVAALDDGGYVVTWTEAGDTGSDIYAQVFGAGGQARGQSFLVNDVVAGNQVNPSVAAIGHDDFVISWWSPDGIKAATFSANGTAGSGGPNGDAGNNILRGTQGADVLNGAGGDDQISGGGGGDTLSGGTGNDMLRGDAGNDALAGGEGDDVILGGAGIDRLTGGAGADLFVFRSLAEIGNGGTLGTSDVITDLQNGVDKIDVSRLALDASAFTFSHYLAYTAVKIDADHDGQTDAILLVKGDVTVSDLIL